MVFHNYIDDDEVQLAFKAAWQLEAGRYRSWTMEVALQRRSESTGSDGHIATSSHLAPAPIVKFSHPYCEYTTNTCGISFMTLTYLAD